MTKDELKEEIKQRVKITDIFTPQKGKQGGLVCPLPDCKSGQDGDGAFTIYPETNTFYCFSCGQGGDVISLYQKLKGADFNRALSELGGMIHLDPAAAPTPRKENRPIFQEKPPADFMQYYIDCRERLFAPDESGLPGIEYIQKRGLDLGVCCEFYVGYDPQADPAGSGFKCPRLIIPTSKSHYVARAIYDDQVEKKYRKMNPAGQRAGIFNIKTLKKQEAQEVIFICEGAIDALSFLSVEAEAIALNSKDNVKKFLKMLEADRPRAEITFVIAMDNDEAGKKGAAELAAGFRRLGLSFIMAGDIYGGRKDANEALCADREAFIQAIERARYNTAARPDNVSSYIDSFMGADMEHFNREIMTGLPSFDAKTGGLYPGGLYVLAAISSLGKTALALQLADNLAEQGVDCLFFSLEMSRLELVSRSICRTIAKRYPKKNITAVDVRKGRLPADVLPCVEEYRAAVKDRLSIVEGNFEADISSIGDYVRKYIDKTKTRPVVFLDYLQILQPREEDARKMKREAIDNTVSELKRLARGLDVPIIVISSVNRANYQLPIAFESLKESGNIEFSADVVLGLQLQCLSEPLFDAEKKVTEKRERVKEAKNENPRKLELVCLKNRYGKGFSLVFDYYPAKELFVDMGEKEEKGGTAKARRRI